MSEGQELGLSNESIVPENDESMPTEVSEAFGQILAGETPEFRSTFNKVMNQMADKVAEYKMGVLKTGREVPAARIATGSTAGFITPVEAALSQLAKRSGGRQVTSETLKSIPGYDRNER